MDEFQTSFQVSFNDILFVLLNAQNQIKACKNTLSALNVKYILNKDQHKG